MRSHRLTLHLTVSSALSSAPTCPQFLAHLLRSSLLPSSPSPSSWKPPYSWGQGCWPRPRRQCRYQKAPRPARTMSRMPDVSPTARPATSTRPRPGGEGKATASGAASHPNNQMLSSQKSTKKQGRIGATSQLCDLRHLTSLISLSLHLLLCKTGKNKPSPSACENSVRSNI